MANLLTAATLAKWTQNDPAEVAADPFAKDLIAKVSGLACWLGGHDGTKLDELGDTIPEWVLEAGAAQAPIDVQMVVLQVCKRSYENPGQVIAFGNIGPLGGDRVADTQAIFADFTKRERGTLTAYNPDGDPDPDPESGVVFVLKTTRGEDSLMSEPTLYVGDNQQIALGDSADPREWKIPLFNPGDPGDPNNYDPGV